MDDKKTTDGPKDNRYRNYSFILYPESCIENWREKLSALHVAWCESPLHDKDVNEDGTKKKPHWHIVLMFTNKKSFKQIEEITKSVNGTIPQPIQNLRGMIRYLAHLDNPEKYQYSKLEIKGHDGFDVLNYIDTTTDINELKLQITKYIRENNIKEYNELVYYCMDTHPDDWFPIVSRQTLFFNTLVRSNRHCQKLSAADQKNLLREIQEIEEEEEEENS